MGIMKTRKMVQGAMIAGLFGVLSLINTYTGNLFDIFIGYAMVVGIVWYGYQYSFKDTLMTIIASMIVVMMVSTPYFIIISFTSCLSGITVSELIKRKAGLFTIMIAVTIVCFLNNILIYDVFSVLTGISLTDSVKQGYDMMVQMYPSIKEVYTIEMIISILPMALVLVSALEMYVIVMILWLSSLKLRFPFPKRVHISYLRLSRKWGYFLAIMMFIGYGLTMVEEGTHYGMYIYTLCSLGFLIQGVATISFIGIVLQKKWIMIIGIITAFIGGINQIHIILGMIDIFSDLRKNLLYNK